MLSVVYTSIQTRATEREEDTNKSKQTTTDSAWQHILGEVILVLYLRYLNLPNQSNLRTNSSENGNNQNSKVIKHD